ncbi:MAG TPA: DUF1566 domain-containing protein [Bacteroidales bacterium]|jgi:hypothetical protein|nr:DUF1566 domain-containing protein [Bacteroidales bacterium]HNZ43240.1 DUF1566 domain-containing protein [Bacteroidales bacterium]HOH84333.1 DUF1566 domain-containing protein [Bacteroidales bacterium]HPB25315.1 DUF1566 domain-containing protein [Bacteroidales bacterium]HPI29236.1 DUF1566 domain-containing protein [Bacteroidales bacterium]
MKKQIFLSFALTLLSFTINAQYYHYYGDTVRLALPVYNGNLQWQQTSDTTAVWVDIPGATYQPYEIAVASSNYYRARVINGSCNPVFSQVKAVRLYNVQQRLDHGETPKHIFDTGIPTDSLYGKTYQGGLIFYLNTINGNGLVAAPFDQSTGAEWGCHGTAISGADGTVIGTGAQNTLDIEASCATVGSAADICANLILGAYSDWFLPSRDELHEMYNNLKVKGFGGFSNNYYWSSSECATYELNDAWLQNFQYGNQYNYVKYNPTYVRAVRAF